jgi:hypothetical protein
LHIKKGVHPVKSLLQEVLEYIANRLHDKAAYGSNAQSTLIDIGSYIRKKTELSAEEKATVAAAFEDAIEKIFGDDKILILKFTKSRHSLTYELTRAFLEDSAVNLEDYPADSTDNPFSFLDTDRNTTLIFERACVRR